MKVFCRDFLTRAKSKVMLLLCLCTHRCVCESLCVCARACVCVCVDDRHGRPVLDWVLAEISSFCVDCPVLSGLR